MSTSTCYTCIQDKSCIQDIEFLILSCMLKALVLHVAISLYCFNVRSATGDCSHKQPVPQSNLY